MLSAFNVIENVEGIAISVDQSQTIFPFVATVPYSSEPYNNHVPCLLFFDPDAVVGSVSF